MLAMGSALANDRFKGLDIRELCDRKIYMSGTLVKHWLTIFEPIIPLQGRSKILPRVF